MKLTIIVTVYNEVKTIKQAIDDVRSLDVDKEIIVIDNCSTDGTCEILEALTDYDIEIVYQDRNYGVGKSFEKGFELANGEFVFIQHADLEYEYRKCLDMLRLAERVNLDAVFASRIKDLLKIRSKWSLLKERPAYLASYISTYLINRWYGYNFTDVIGAELYRTTVIKEIPINTYNAGFKFEHVSRMCKKKLKIGEINIGYKPRENSSGKTIKAYHMLNALYAMVRVRLFD